MLDPRPYAVGEIVDLYRQYPHIGPVLPAMGYSETQVAELRATIDRSDAEFVVAGTPIDLGRDVQPRLPVVRTRYEYADGGVPDLWSVIGPFVDRLPRRA